MKLLLMLKTLLVGGIFNLSWIKYLGVAVTAIGGYYVLVTHYENKGYTKAQLEFQSKENKLVAKMAIQALADQRLEISKALNKQQLLFASKLELVNQTSKVKEVIKYATKEVNKIVYVDGKCTNFGNSFSELLNTPINTVNSSKAIKGN